MFNTRRILQLQRVPLHLYRSFFNRVQKSTENSIGLFGNPLLTTPAGFVELNKRVRSACAKIAKDIADGREDRTTVKLFDDLSNEICKAADLAECTRQLHSDSAFAKAAENSARDFCQLVESFNTMTHLYNKLRCSKDLESDRLNDVDRRTLDLFLDDFEQSGVHLSENQRAEFVSLSEEIFDAGSKFQWGTDRDVEVGKSDKIAYGLDSTIIRTPLTNSARRDKRKFIHSTYYQHNKQQEEELCRLICRRDELARLTGFKSFAHRAQYNTLLGSYDNAHSFLWGLIQTLRPSAQRELAVLLDVQSQCEDGIKTVGEWDIHYLTHLYKEKAYGNSLYQASEKFMTLGNLLRGFGEIVGSLYGLKLKEEKPEHGEVWEGTVIKLSASDAEGRFLGHIYMDIDRRPNKAAGDCHYTVRCSKELGDGIWQRPIVVLSLSLSDEPTKDWESVRCGFHAAENVFHELGHAMHSMLGCTQYQHVAGTRCPQDFSEIPSNLMEYFFNDLNVMQRVLRDKSGDCIQIKDAAGLIASRFAFTSLETVQQAAYALFDLELHGPDGARLIRDGHSTTQIFHSIYSKALPDIERNPHSAFHHRFHHLVQYGSKYYSYLVARSTASLIWNSQFRRNPFNRTNGLKWAEVQSYGGGKPPSELLRSLLGYTPTAGHLVAALDAETSPVANLDAISL